MNITMKENKLPLAQSEQINILKQIKSQMDVTHDTDRLNQLEQERQKLFDTFDFFDQVFEKDGKWGVRRVDGTEIVPPEYDEIPVTYRYDLSVSAYAVVKDGKCGLVSTIDKGKMLTEYKYDYLEYDPLASGWHSVTDKKNGFLDLQGNEIAPCEWTQCYQMCDGIMPVMTGDKCGFVTYDMKYVRPEYEEMEPVYYGSGPVKVRKGDTWGYILRDTLSFITCDEYEAHDGEYDVIYAD